MSEINIQEQKTQKKIWINLVLVNPSGRSISQPRFKFQLRRQISFPDWFLEFVFKIKTISDGKKTLFPV